MAVIGDREEWLKLYTLDMRFTRWRTPPRGTSITGLHDKLLLFQRNGSEAMSIQVSTLSMALLTLPQARHFYAGSASKSCLLMRNKAFMDGGASANNSFLNSSKEKLPEEARELEKDPTEEKSEAVRGQDFEKARDKEMDLKAPITSRIDKGKEKSNAENEASDSGPLVTEVEKFIAADPAVLPSSKKGNKRTADEDQKTTASLKKQKSDEEVGCTSIQRGTLDVRVAQMETENLLD